MNRFTVLISEARGCKRHRRLEKDSMQVIAMVVKKFALQLTNLGLILHLDLPKSYAQIFSLILRNDLMGKVQPKFAWSFK